MDPSYYTIELTAHDNGWRAKLRSASGRVLAEANSRDHNDSLVETLAHQAIAAQADRHEYWSTAKHTYSEGGGDERCFPAAGLELDELVRATVEAG